MHIVPSMEILGTSLSQRFSSLGVQEMRSEMDMNFENNELEYIAKAIAEVHAPGLWDRLTINGVLRNSYIADARAVMRAVKELDLLSSSRHDQ